MHDFTIGNGWMKFLFLVNVTIKHTNNNCLKLSIKTVAKIILFKVNNKDT